MEVINKYTPKVSVIVPIYLVENYIERCVRSLFNQTLDSIEFIFIDDCSPDTSVLILNRLVEEYSAKLDYENKEVRVIRLPKNVGLPNVRKYGVQIAKGDYILHCDSDDWTDVTMCENLYNKAVESNSDIVICDFYQASTSSNKHIKTCYSTSKNDIIIEFMYGRGYWALWNKLIKRDLYKYVEYYPDGNMGEDMVITLQLLYYSNNISYIDQPYYYYYINSNSIVRDTSAEKILNRFNQAIMNTQIVEKFYLDKLKGCRFRFALDSIKLRHRNLILPLIQNSEYFQLWRYTYPDLNNRVWCNPFISIRSKLKFYLILFGFLKHI